MISRLKPYPSYKDSGVVWLERVPKQWELQRLKAFVAQINEQTSSKTSNDVYIALEHVESWTGRVRPPVGEVSFDSQVKRFRRGDVLFGKLRPYLAKVARLPVDGVCVGEFLVLRPRSYDVTPEFLEKILRSKTIIDTINSSTFGAKMPRAEWGFIGSLLLGFPPLDEQAAIVRFLDHAEALIRRYIRAKQKLIKLVEEEKQAIIQHAVTRGLDPNVALKPSGLKWVGDVPESWTLALNRTLMRKRKILVGERHSEYQLLSLTKQGIIVRDVESGKGKFSSDMGTSQEVHKGDLVFCLFDVPETPRTVGLSQYDGMITGAYTVFECPDPVLAGFLDLFYRAMDDRKLLSPLYSGLRNTIPPSRFLGIKTPIPSHTEQIRILQFVDEATADINRTISVAQREIVLLREYSARLISEVVTGKIDVREAAALLPKEEPEAELLDETDDVLQDESVAEDTELEAADVA